MQPRADAHTVLRSLRPLACCLRSFSESCAALDAASSGAAAAAFCWFSWKQHLFLDARHQHRCLAAVQQHVWRLKQKRVRLTVHQVRSLHMLIPVRPHVDSAWQAKLFRCASFMQAQLCLQSMPRAIRPVLSLMVLNIYHAAFCCFVLARHAPKLRCHIPLSISQSRSHSQINSKSGISHSYPGIT